MHVLKRVVFADILPQPCCMCCENEYRTSAKYYGEYLCVRIENVNNVRRERARGRYVGVFQEFGVSRGMAGEFLMGLRKVLIYL